MARLTRRQHAATAIAGGLFLGLPLGFGSACNDIVALECDTDMPGTVCPPRVTDDGTSTTDASTVTSPSTVTASTTETATTEPVPDTSAEDPTGIDTGSFCGDGIVDPGEECDDGDGIDIDECDNECRVPGCGNGIVQPGEDCDNGTANDDHGACKLDCTAAVCGDGIVRWGVESCDGGDTDELDCTAFGYGGGVLLCDAACELDLSLCTLCPDGGEACDAYQPCDGECSSGAPCYIENGKIGTCLPTCMSPDECPASDMFVADCVVEVCVIPCEFECPRGMLCQPSSLYPGTVCLW